MNRTPFAVYRQLKLAVDWYGTDYEFFRKRLNEYNEPVDDEADLVQEVRGIYHASERSFVELINNEGASIKSKANKGILCSRDESLELQQGDYVEINGPQFYVTAIEPIMYADEVVAYEISVEELVEGNDLL